MPFPWKKKNRVTRISQIVADFQSPKRGRSLFVETGFPTSLIDLFVKNRNRFKKSRFRKPVHSENIDPSQSPSPPPPPPSSPVTPPSPIHEASSTPNPLIRENTNTDESAVGSSPPVEKLTSTFRSKAIIVKTLTVIVLAASVKELTVAITVSAFALLFLENALKRAVSCLKPCSNASVSIESQFQKILFRDKENEIQQPVTAFNEIELLNLNEIEAVEEEEKSEECGELEDSLVSECKIKGKGSRSGRFKATMVKKLQKFRSRKEKKEEEKGISISIFNNNNNYSHEDNEVEDKEAIIIIKNEVRDDCGIAYSTESIIAGKKNSGYAILVMIVLVGLIVGRLQALILTIGWCFLVKMVKVIWR